MKINFMGDVMFAELLETLGNGLLSTLRRTGADPFAHVRPLLDEGDLNVVNLECVLSDTSSLAPPFSRILITPERFVHFLADNRINIVNTANNHALDHGVAAFERSCDLLRSHGIAIIGYDKGRFFQEDPVVLRARERSAGFLGYNIANFPASDREAVIARAVAAIKRARPAVDTLVVSIHWGEEYTNVPPPFVLPFGKRILEAGCDILHGHHSHQIQGVYADGRRVFAPSLGNFVFDQKVAQNRITAVLQVRVTAEGLEHRYVPFRMNHLYQPEPAPQLAGYLERLDADLRECWEGRGERFAEVVEARVHAGHFRNRLRMRVMMLAHFWNYLPYAGKILRFRQSRKKVFSVIDCLESLPGA